jgi:hypothetical protein
VLPSEARHECASPRLPQSSKKRQKANPFGAFGRIRARDAHRIALLSHEPSVSALYGSENFRAIVPASLADFDRAGARIFEILAPSAVGRQIGFSKASSLQRI